MEWAWVSANTVIPYFTTYLIYYITQKLGGGAETTTKETDFRFGISIENYTNNENK